MSDKYFVAHDELILDRVYNRIGTDYQGMIKKTANDNTIRNILLGCASMDCCKEFRESINDEAASQIKRVIFNPPATIILWRDGTKTVVRVMEGEKYDWYAGFCAAFTKGILGSKCRARKVCEENGNLKMFEKEYAFEDGDNEEEQSND